MVQEAPSRIIRGHPTPRTSRENCLQAVLVEPSPKHIQHWASALCPTTLAWDGEKADGSEARLHTILWQGADRFGLGVDRRTWYVLRESRCTRRRRKFGHSTLSPG